MIGRVTGSVSLWTKYDSVSPKVDDAKKGRVVRRDLLDPGT